jgi:hypothetical protein
VAEDRSPTFTFPILKFGRIAGSRGKGALALAIDLVDITLGGPSARVLIVGKKPGMFLAKPYWGLHLRGFLASTCAITGILS